MQKAGGRLAEAESLYREAVEQGDRHLAPDHWFRGLFRRGLAALLVYQERFTEAERLFLEAHTCFEASLGPDNRKTVEVRQDLVRLYEKTGKPEEAAAWRRAAD